MKKSLIALAVVGTFAAPAMAATSNVDIYGLLNVAVENVDNDKESHSRLTTGNNSAIGFKGTEDLGGGLKAVWQIETNVSVDGDSTSGAAAGAFNGTRNTYLGLAGGFGTVLFGVHDTPYKMSTGKLDNFVGTLGDYNSIMGSYGGAANAEFDLRPSNVIAYVSPDFSGFKVVAGYVLSGDSNVVSNADEGDAWSLSGTYTNGPLFVTAAYESHNLVGAAAAAGGGTIILANGATDVADRDAWKVGVGYAFGDLTVGAMYESIDVDPNVGSDTGRDSWMVQASYAMGPMTFKAMYMDADDLDNTDDSGATQWSLGLDYALSKRTKAYFVYSDLDNDDNVNYTLGSAGTNQVTGSANGSSQNGFAIGLVHSF